MVLETLKQEQCDIDEIRINKTSTGNKFMFDFVVKAKLEFYNDLMMQLSIKSNKISL